MTHNIGELQANHVTAPEDVQASRPSEFLGRESSGVDHETAAIAKSYVLSTPPVSNVLIVDDDPLLRKILYRWLTQAGYQVREAPNGTEAIQSIEADPPDIVITDWEMPGLEGPQLCRRLRELSLPHYVYVIILTSRNDPRWVVEGLDSGADDFLSKPIREAELVARLRAATRILESERKLQRLAKTDPLTGVLTQRSFYDILCYELQRARRSESPLACAMVDLDFFKRINDVHGHPVGDTVLKTTANLLLRSCRRSDVIARYGGEEFCVLLPDTTEEGAVAWAERFRAQLSATSIPVGDKALTITCSVGVSVLYDDTLTPEQLVDQADQALLCAKRTARNKVVSYQWLNQGVDLDLQQPNRRRDLFEGIRAEHVMTPIVAPLQGDETVEHVAAYLLRSRISSAPVVDKQGRLIGIVSEKDLMEAITSADGWQRPISQLMRPHVITYPLDTPIRVIYEFLCRVAMRRVIITDQGVPVGAVSRASLLRWYRNLVLAERLKDQPKAESPEAIICEALTRIGEERDKIKRTLAVKPPDLAAHLVGAASRIQELAVDILSCAAVVEAGEAGTTSVGASTMAD